MTWEPIDGVDLEDAKTRIDDAELFFEMLEELAETWGDGASRIRAPVAAGQRARAAELAHALAGVAGTLAVTRVHEVARRLEARLLDSSDDVETDLRALEEHLAALGEALRRRAKG